MTIETFSEMSLRIAKECIAEDTDMEVNYPYYRDMDVLKFALRLRAEMTYGHDPEFVPRVTQEHSVNCRETKPGKGWCDRCAEGDYEHCRYLPVSVAATLGKFDQNEINVKAEALRLEDALRELVACKDLKEAIASDPSEERTPEFDSMVAEYNRRKPLAWKAARAEIARRRESPTEQIVADRVGLIRGLHVG